MQHVTHTAQIDVPVATCFLYIDNYRNVPRWFFGVSEFTPVGEPERGMGTTVSIAAKLGPITLRGRGKVCEYVENEVIAVRAELGSVAVVLVWLFRPTSDGGTEIAADITYDTAPGLTGRVVAKLAETAIGPAIEKSERSLRRQLLAAV